MGDPDGRPGGKTFVTHKKPHLDEVTAAWLLRKYDPEMRRCDFLFITNTPEGGDVPPGSQYVPVGVGRGKFDEHGRRSGYSACQLVYDDLLHRGLIPNDEVKKKAIEMVVEYTHREDTAQWATTDIHQTAFSIPAILRGLAIRNSKDPSPIMMDRGIEMIDAVYANLKEYAKFLTEWENRIEFESVWGPAVGVHSAYRGADKFAYHHGFVLRVQTDPTKPFGDYRADPKSTVDLKSIYDQLIAREPGSWYLHQTHKILVSNSDSSLGSKRPATNLTLQQLIDLVKK